MTAEDLPEPAAWIVKRDLMAPEYISDKSLADLLAGIEDNDVRPVFTLDQLLAERQRAERAEAERDRLLGMVIARENLKAHLGIDADKAAVDVTKKFMLQRNEATARAEAAEARVLELEQDLRIAQGNTDAAISDYNNALERIKEAEAARNAQERAGFAESIRGDDLWDLLKEAMAVIEPFADEMADDRFSGNRDDERLDGFFLADFKLTIGHLRAAAKFMEKAKP